MNNQTARSSKSSNVKPEEREHCLKIYENIKDLQYINRRTNVNMAELMGIKTSLYTSKIFRLKRGMSFAFTIGDVAKMSEIFGCSPSAFFDGVNFDLKEKKEKRP